MIKKLNKFKNKTYFYGFFLLFLLLGSPFLNIFLWIPSKSSFDLSFDSASQTKDFPPSSQKNLSRSLASLKITFEEDREGIDPREREKEEKKARKTKRLLNKQKKAQSLALAKDFLQMKRMSFMSQMGRSPSKRDKLRYELLRGKYKLKFYNEKLEKIQFYKNEMKNNNPLSSFKPKDFIKNYEGFFPKSRDLKNTLPLIEIKERNNEVLFHEIYTFKDLSETSFEARFILDSEKRFLSLRVQELFFF